MPQIGPDLWKVGLSFFWYREYQDGRIESEFDLDTGEIRLWGAEAPEGLKKVGWLPMTPDLAQKIKVWGEIGYPVQAQAVMITLHSGEVPIIFKDCSVITGLRVTCKVCGSQFQSMARPEVCPQCGAKPAWRCDTCGKLQESEICPDCQAISRKIMPFAMRSDAWEEVIYNLKILEKFHIRFNNHWLTVDH